MNGRDKLSPVDRPERRRNRLLNIPAFQPSNLETVPASNPFPLIRLRTLCPRRSISNSFASNHFRTLARATEGEGIFTGHVAGHPQLTPSRLPFFSAIYALPNLQALCFVNVATVGGVGGALANFVFRFSSFELPLLQHAQIGKEVRAT